MLEAGEKGVGAGDDEESQEGGEDDPADDGDGHGDSGFGARP